MKRIKSLELFLLPTILCIFLHYNHYASGFQGATTFPVITKGSNNYGAKRNRHQMSFSSKNPSRVFDLHATKNGKNDMDDELQNDNDIPSQDSSKKLFSSLFSTKNLLDGASNRMDNTQEKTDLSNQSSLNRRLFLGSALLGTSVLVGSLSSSTGLINTIEVANAMPEKVGNKLSWESTPVNKRTGVTVFDAEKAGYNVRFVTYLSRFLLVFDDDCQKWWYARAADIPRRATLQEVEDIRLKQFGAFSASVEVGLQEYRGPDGPAKLMKSLLLRYCPDIETVRAKRAKFGLPELSPSEDAKEIREIKEARRQIALLFGLMETNQPVEQITKLLAAIDNGKVASVTIEDGGSGYAPGYGSPLVQFPPPKAGPDYKTATGRAILKPNGKLLRIDFVNRGFGYQKPPTVTISAPGADRGVDIPGARPATAQATIFKTGPNKGRLQSILIDDPGAGYNDQEKIRIIISPPELPAEEGGEKAVAKAIPEYSVAAIEITDPGSGYVVEKPLPVYVEPPPITARVNMNDPLSARAIDPNKPIPTANIPPPKYLKETTSVGEQSSFSALVDKMAKNEGKGGGGGCIGRGCYDKPVVAYGTAVAEASSFSRFRSESDARVPVEKENEVVKTIMKKTVSGTSSGPDAQLPLFWSGAPKSSSEELLTLLPAGLGLEYEENLKRYVLSAGPDFIDINKLSKLDAPDTPLDPEFGPRGRSPIERDLTLDLNTFARFCASGAICAAGSHLVLTPLDVIKTKIQTDRENYPGVVASFKKLSSEYGLTGFFVGWVPTTIGFFFWGGFTYSVTELLRRYFSDALGPQAASYDVPIILSASAIAAFFSVFILGPFEAIRIRTVYQPDYGKNMLDVTGRIIKEEGVGSFFSATVPLLFKEIPFGVTKFFVFGLATKFLYQMIPAAQEDIQLSLFISLAGGMCGGLAAAIVSNPADATISEMKKAKTKLGPGEAVKNIIESGGPANLMRGLPVRMAFYPLIVSIQFTVYDAVRLYLGVGSDDLKVYLDVLGGALKDGGTAIGPL